MKKLTLSIISVSLVISSSYAIPMKFSSSIYGASLNYDSSNIRDNGYVSGIYGYLGIGWYHSLEFGLDYTHIKYKYNQPNLDQTDLTFIYTNYSFPKVKAKMGFHYIDSDDKLSDGGYTVILGLERYEPYKWNAGIDLFYTKYGDYINLNGSKGLDVYQITGKLGFSFGNYYRYGSFYLELLPSYIGHSDNAGFGKSFSSLEGRLNYYISSFSFTLSGWTGERSFFVDKGGFVVYNLQEKYKYGVGAEMGYSINRQLGIRAGINYQNLKERNNPNDVKIMTYVLNLGYSF